MTIYTDGELRIRKLEATDAELLVKWLSNPKVLAFYEGRDRPHNLEMVRKHFFLKRMKRLSRVLWNMTELQSVTFNFMSWHQKIHWRMDTVQKKSRSSVSISLLERPLTGIGELVRS